jgi:hypothetical protein
MMRLSPSDSDVPGPCYGSINSLENVFAICEAAFAGACSITCAARTGFRDGRSATESAIRAVLSFWSAKRGWG